MNRIFLKAAAIAGLSIAVATPVLADAIDDTIKARRAYYQLVFFNFGQVVAMAKGEAPYDAEAAKNASTNLQAISKLHIAPLFPKGSDNVAKKGQTRALPKIWEDFAGASKIAGDWRAAIDGLVTVAGNGKEALGPAVGAVGKQCSACHDAYRAKDL